MTRWRFIVVLGLAVVVSLACDSPQSMLDPQSPNTREIDRLWWFMLAVASFVVVLVTALTVIALFRPRRGALSEKEPIVPIVAMGAGFTTVVIVILMGWMIAIMATEERDPDVELVVEVIGHMWWWEVHYPDYGIVTANEIHVPVGTPVRFMLSSNDVIHSFWVPKLQGKMDLVPGATNELLVLVEEPGVYHGQCYEFCGLQHANMLFFLIGDEDFDDWVQAHQEPVAIPDDPFLRRGWEVFFAASCAQCHALRGSEAQGVAGPDLTRLGSRMTLGSGIIQNSAGSLSGWILDPHQAKPGNFMPPTVISGEDLAALVEFLNSLE